jgi:hypothetical protein
MKNLALLYVFIAGAINMLLASQSEFMIESIVGIQNILWIPGIFGFVNAIITAVMIAALIFTTKQMNIRSTPVSLGIFIATSLVLMLIIQMIVGAALADNDSISNVSAILIEMFVSGLVWVLAWKLSRRMIAQ